MLFSKGKIGPRELRKAFKQLGETVSEEEILAMVCILKLRKFDSFGI